MPAVDFLYSVAGNTPPTKKKIHSFLNKVKQCCEIAEWEPETPAWSWISTVLQHGKKPAGASPLQASSGRPVASAGCCKETLRPYRLSLSHYRLLYS